MPRPVKLNPVSVGRNECVRGEERWKACTLFERAKELEPFDMPVAGLPTGTQCWSGACSAQVLAEEIVRTMRADLNYPIILSEDGFVLDGWHRVAKALVEGRETVKAVRFEKDPEPDYVVKEE